MVEKLQLDGLLIIFCQNTFKMNSFIEKWLAKSFWAKVTDVVFVIFIVLLLIPSTRLFILKEINAVKANIIKPRIKKENLKSLSRAFYQWQIVDTEGKLYQLQEFEGKVLFINFWATWCGPCLGEMPQIQKLYDVFKNNEDVKFLIVTDDNYLNVRKFLEKNNYTFPVYFATMGIPDELSINSIPTTLIIDREGNIVVRTVGAANWYSQKIQNLIKELVSK